MGPDVYEQLIAAVSSYNIPHQAVELLNTHPPLLIAGVTAAGKDTIVQEIVQSGGYQRIVTHTTRQMRLGEQNGENYWFIDETEMLQLIKAQTLMDIKVVHQTTIYGTTTTAFNKVIQAGLKPLWVLDIQGVSGIMKYLPTDIRPVFILPPDFQTWLERMEKQGPINLDERKRRLHSAKAELREVLKNESYLVFINSEISITAHQITSKVADAKLQDQNRQVAGQLLDDIRDY